MPVCKHLVLHEALKFIRGAKIQDPGQMSAVRLKLPKCLRAIAFRQVRLDDYSARTSPKGINANSGHAYLYGLSCMA
jgi:hypothetical protein